MTRNSDLSKNDIAWVRLFEKYGVLEHVKSNGSFEIAAAQINEFREARLMTKFDHRINLPRLFKDNQLTILPVTRGSYVISEFEAYHDFTPLGEVEVSRASLPEHITSIDYENITSEAAAINCAFASGILADFLDDEELLPTVSGRMSSEVFSFQIRNSRLNAPMSIDVANSQVEIDGGYEGIRQLALVEAKNFVADDFLVRQLYYPYRLWTGKISKKITPVFLVYSNMIYHLYEYQFISPCNYNSLVLVKHKHYSLEPVDITLDAIINILHRAVLVPEPAIPFPQADSFERVINLCELLNQGEKTQEDISHNYAFDPRQADYYANAARYLGLVTKEENGDEVSFSLTAEGRRVLNLRYKDRQLGLANAILRHKAFNGVLNLHLQHGEMPPRHVIVAVMRECNLYRVEAESTYYRRAATVASWINWILGLQR